MQLPPTAPLAAFVSFCDLRSVDTARLVAGTKFPRLIAGPTPATHAILTQLKRGERIRQFDAKTVLIQQLQWHHHFFRHFLA